MLDGLDRVDWDRLTHAYGPAGDVPGRLRALTSPDPKARAEACEGLHATICHQGSRYRASAPAVPFLFEILESPGTADRVSLIRLLEGLAVGYPEWHVRRGFDPVEAHADADELGDPAAARAAEPDDEEDEDAPRIALWRRDAYEAVRDGLEIFQRLTRDPERAVRLAAVKPLSWFPDAAGRSACLVRETLDGPIDPEETANALLALGYLAHAGGDSFDAPRLLAALDGPPPVRLAAAIALAVILGSSAPPESLGVLLDAVQDPQRTTAEAAAVHWHWLGPLAHAGAAIQLIGPAPEGPTLDALCRAAERVTESMAGAEVFSALLGTVIPDPESIARDPATGFRRLAPAGLTADQRRALGAIGRAPVWDVRPFYDGHLMDVGLEYGFSWDPGRFRAFLEEARRTDPGA